MVPPPPRVCLSHSLSRDLGGGGEVGREAGQQTLEAWERESSGAGVDPVRKEALARGGRGGRARRTQPGRAEGVCGGGGERPFPSEWSRGTSSRGSPHPAAPNLENKGSGKHGRGRGAEVEGSRKAGGGGREGASPHFLSRRNDGRLPPANASLRSLQNPGGLGFLT